MYRIMYVPDSTFLLYGLHYYKLEDSNYSDSYKICGDFDEFSKPKEFEMLFLAESCLQNWCLRLGIRSNNKIIPSYQLCKGLFEIIGTEEDYYSIGNLKIYK